MDTDIGACNAEIDIREDNNQSDDLLAEYEKSYVKKALVLVADYPNNEGGVALMYVHTRNKYYVQHEIDVTVLNFAASKDYNFEGIKVITYSSYKRNKTYYDTLVLHASNLRNHFRFLIKYEKRFKHLVFFFHGHEVMLINEAYPEPYAYVKKENLLKLKLQDLYDHVKLFVWHYYLPQIAYKSDFIFVSNWFFKEFKRYTKLNENDLENRIHIINNCVGKVFEEKNYNFAGKKEFDFVTVRSYLDGSKYCIDVISELALKYPQYKFLVIGKGEFYFHNKKPDNLEWVEKFLDHREIMEYTDKAYCALLPTRLDAQGVMMCEFATYGIPVITSDIEVCKEVLGDLPNIALINHNNTDEINLCTIYEKLMVNRTNKKINKFNYINTVNREEKIIKKICRISI